MKNSEMDALKINHRAVMASVKLGAWLSAALDDPDVCDEMKSDIKEWFSAGDPSANIPDPSALKRVAELELELETAANWIQELSFLIPPPNEFTPRFCAIAINMRLAAHRYSDER